jgi:hypothetical protein
MRGHSNGLPRDRVTPPESQQKELVLTRRSEQALPACPLSACAPENNLLIDRELGKPKDDVHQKNPTPATTEWKRCPSGTGLAMAPVTRLVPAMQAIDVAQYMATWRPTRARGASFPIQ